MLKAEDLTGVYNEIAELINVETAIEMHKHFAGSQVTFPLKLVTLNYTYYQIYNEFDGTNIRALAIKYGYSNRWIKDIIKEVATEVCKEDFTR